MLKRLAASAVPACWVGLAMVGVSPAAAGAAPVVQVLDQTISLAQVEAAQDAWCQGLLQISADYTSGGASKAKATAAAVIDQAYAYQHGPVAFKPTLASGAQTFRTTRAGALAYFVGQDPNFPADSGFALKGWRQCTIQNKVVQLRGSMAITMGQVTLTDAKGQSTTVDKTWAFEREPDGGIRIVLHHSSLPFTN